jgi:hypothetical protein
MRVGSCERVSSASEGYTHRDNEVRFLYIARYYRCVKQSTDALRFSWKYHLAYVLLSSSHIHQYLSPIQILRRFLGSRNIPPTESEHNETSKDRFGEF